MWYGKYLNWAASSMSARTRSTAALIVPLVNRPLQCCMRSRSCRRVIVVCCAPYAKIKSPVRSCQTTHVLKLYPQRGVELLVGTIVSFRQERGHSQCLTKDFWSIRRWNHKHSLFQHQVDQLTMNAYQRPAGRSILHQVVEEALRKTPGNLGVRVALCVLRYQDLVHAVCD